MTINLRIQLQLHQEATDTCDSEMLNLVCQWIEAAEQGEKTHIIDFIQENLTRGPGQPVRSNWGNPMFTEKDRQAIFDNVREEVEQEFDSKYETRKLIEKLSLAETIGYIFPDDVGVLVEMLQRIDNDDEEQHISGEFLRLNNDEDDYDTMLDFCVRMKLLNETEDTVTELGKQFINTHCGGR